MGFDAAGGRTLLALSDSPGLSPLRSTVAESRDRRRVERYEPAAGPLESLLHRRGGRPIQAFLGDISATGARLVADDAPVVGERFEVVIPIGRCLHVYTAEVVHVGECGEFPEFGVRFVAAPRCVGRPAARECQAIGAA